MDLEQRPPERPGRHNVVEAAVERGEQLRELRFSAAASFSDLAKDYVIFTPALLLCAGIPDPVQDHINYQPHGATVEVSTFEHPLFGGLADPFGKMLWFCLKEDWKLLDISLRAAGVANPAEGWVATAFRDGLTILDSLALEKMAMLPAKLPTVQIVYYGLTGPNREYYLSQPVNFHEEIPTLSYRDPPKSARVFSDAVLDGAAVPHEEAI